ncbi:DUF3369 domain-containing protein [Ectothiorhodospiraceae bacterium BW-2]|nr:DUF3369 domain-containing protein [Ectothiorhodospiraceae bacterium BW-2]
MSMNPEEDEIMFSNDNEEEAATRPPSPSRSVVPGWKLLLVDDDSSVHDVTTLALKNFEFNGRPLHFLHAYSAAEALTLLQQEQDIALALIDVVMETDHAGLDLVRHIRHDLQNRTTRLVLRTGQPGQAPERSIIRDYDINDYKEKTELSSQKLYTTVMAGLRSYQDIMALEANRQGLHRVINASRELFRPQHLPEFIQGVLQQLVAVLYLDKNSLFVHTGCFAMECDDEQNRITAATGDYEAYMNRDPHDVFDDDIINAIDACLQHKHDILTEHHYTAYFSPANGREGVLYLTTPHRLSNIDYELVKLFCHNASIAYQNIVLREEVEQTQSEIVYMLGEAIERRSKETGNHVYRVAAYSELLARLVGLDEQLCRRVLIAAPLHDFGKIGIPDAILHKPGKLDSEEWTIMQRHAEIGGELLGRSKRDAIRLAATIARQHHEKWNGKGYPLGLKSEEIELTARITALADVFDALQSKRCYKEPWSIDKTMELITREAGEHFDPKLVQLLKENLALFIAVRERYPDPD